MKDLGLWQPAECPGCKGHDWSPKGFQGYVQCNGDTCNRIFSPDQWKQLMAEGARREGLSWVTYEAFYPIEPKGQRS